MSTSQWKHQTTDKLYRLETPHLHQTSLVLELDTGFIKVQLPLLLVAFSNEFLLLVKFIAQFVLERFSMRISNNRKYFSMGAIGYILQSRLFDGLFDSILYFGFCFGFCDFECWKILHVASCSFQSIHRQIRSSHFRLQIRRIVICFDCWESDELMAPNSEDLGHKNIIVLFKLYENVLYVTTSGQRVGSRPSNHQ